MVRPSGTVTFLFTDIEGSTRLWETDPDSMQTALIAHDEVLRTTIEAHDGWLFKHTGDGVCAAFGSARAAIDAAVDAQRCLELPVRMGVATGEAQERDGDYFGPVLNRAARVMAAGHGGQIVVAGSAAALLDGVDLIDLGEHRLRDLSVASRLFQIRAEGLPSGFPPLQTLDTNPGNLPTQLTSFVGRHLEVTGVTELLREHRLVTLTGVGGVGKTRLAVQVAADLAAEFPDGVWLIELAPLGDPAALPDAVASMLRVTSQAGLTVTDSIAHALSGRRLLVVLDNCEHLLDAAADLVDAIMSRAATPKVLATSREGLGVPGERLWPVPPLETECGVSSAAVDLFVERAKAVNPGFALAEGADADAVVEICQRLDGLALAIELAAARMVSMGPTEALDHLRDRFRFLSSSQRGPERHQTLRKTVAWSYDLLDRDERAVLGRCSVFADGFDLGAAKELCGGDGLDEFAVLDVLESLVRKSLLTSKHTQDQTRYGLLETIRQFAENQVVGTGVNEIRSRHARYFARQVTSNWQLWGGPRQHVAFDWVIANFANLRVGFRWALGAGDLGCATAIAAHTALLTGSGLQLYEPTGWAEETLEAATAADLPQLPRLFLAASFCAFTGRPDAALRYAQKALSLEEIPRYDSIEKGWTSHWVANALGLAGQTDLQLQLYADLVLQPGTPHVLGLCGLTWVLPAVGRAEEAMTIAEETVAAARRSGHSFLIAFALHGYGRAFVKADPGRALDAFRQGLLHSRHDGLTVWESVIARDAARLEAVHGELDEALALFDIAIDSLHRAGDTINLAFTLGNLAVVFHRLERHAVAATLYGATARYATGNPTYATGNLLRVIEQLGVTLGSIVFERCIAAGAAMEPTEGVRYAHDQVRLAQHQLANPT